MSRTRVYGRPGAYASMLMWKAWGAAAVFAGASLVVAWMAFNQAIPFRVGAVAVVVLGAAAYGFFGKAMRARVGVVSEKRALRALRKAGLSDIVCGAFIGSGGDIDLVGLGPQAVAVEVKTGRGAVSVLRNGRLKVGRRTLIGNPLEQAKRGARAVGRALGTNVVGVVCVVDMTQRPLRVEERESTLWICSAADLESVVVSLLPRMTFGEAEAGAVRLMELTAANKAAQKQRKQQQVQERFES